MAWWRKPVKRRELLKSMAAIPLLPMWWKPYSPSSDPPYHVAQLPKGNYVFFVEASALRWEHIDNATVPEGVNIQIVPIFLKYDQCIDEAVRVYKLE